MNSQLRLGVVLPIVLFAALATAVGLFVLSRGQGSPSAVEAVRPLGTAPVARPAAKPKAATKPARTTKAAAKPKPRPKPAVRLRSGLPAPLARALTARPVAVVSLVTPRSQLDETAAAEAAAGARAAGASFASIDMSSEAQAKPLALMLGVLDAPAVIVFRRPGDAFVQFDGFVDRDSVAQAADNAFDGS